MNYFVSPKTFPYLNFLSIFFPFLFFIYVVFTIIWFFLNKKLLWFFSFFILIIIPLIRPWLNFSFNEKESFLKLMSFNIKNNLLENKEPKINFLNKSDVDIMMTQEANVLEISKEKFSNLSIGFPINMIYSCFKIEQEGKIFDEIGVGEGQFADIAVEGKTIRFINIYLEPFSFTKDMIKPVENYNENEKKGKKVLWKMVKTFKVHQEQISEIVDFVKKSPYPVVLSGDFNAVPNSYEYFQISKVLQDAFLQSGIGFSTSFHDYKFPIRIDYIFVSKELQAISYKVYRNIHVSDHYPVIAEIKLAE